ncbi:MAG: undecaprenyl phosphate translocase family protein, partial [Spirochaetota bacterium]
MQPKQPADRPAAVAILLNVFRGFVIGIANVIPGVSGGTLAVVLGIYERLITSIDRLFRLRTGWLLSGFFVFQVLLGAGIGIVTLAHFMERLLERYPYGMAFLFMGLILG